MAAAMEAVCSPSAGGRPGCAPDLLGVAASASFAVLAPCICLCIRNTGCRGKTVDATPRFTAHYWRAFLVTVLLIIHLLEVGEYLVAMEQYAVPCHVVLAPASSSLAVLSGLVLYLMMERRGLAAMLVLQVGYWTSAAAWRLLRLMDMHDARLGWCHVTYLMSAAVCAVQVLLAISDAFTIYVELKWKRDFYAVSKKQYLAKPTKDTCYKHNKANAFSQLTFWWLNVLLWRGYKEPMELEDLGNLPPDENAATQFDRFIKIYNKELISSKLANEKLSLWKCFIKFIWPNYCLGGLFKLLGDCVGLVGPLGISIIIEYTASLGSERLIRLDAQYFPNTTEFFNNGYIMGIIVFLSAIAQGTLSQSSTHLVNIEGIRLKSALQSLVYDKYLRLAPWSVAEMHNENSEVTGVEEEKVNTKETIIKSKKNTEEIKEDNIDGSSMTNLMSEDSFNVMSFIWIGHYTWAIPLKIGVLMFLLYLKLGISAIIGATICICLMTPLQFLIGKKMSRNSKTTADRSDQRMMKINEVLQGIKNLKMYGWEAIFGNKILEAREKELELLNKDSIYWALITFLTHASSVLITLVTFGLYFVLEEDHLTPANVFAGLALFNQLTVPLFIFPVTVPIIISAMVSANRLGEFLSLPELVESVGTINASAESIAKHERKMPPSGVAADNVNSATHFLGNIEEMEEENEAEDFCKETSDKESSTGSSLEDVSQKVESSYAVKISNAIFAWGHADDSSSKITIPDCIKIPKGKLTMVVGKTGSGKTSFLSALIGEMNLVKGKIAWSNDTSLAYTPQKPWLLNTTIRENILFGSTLHARHYKRVLGACSLRADLAALPARDLTEAGERGAALSGGQRLRVGLARALYSRAGALLLDDPLAALDQPVAQKVFEKGIRKMCLKGNQTVIMVTHKLQLLSYADQIIYIDNGIVRSMGSLARVEELEPGLAQEWRGLLSRGRLEEQPGPPRERTARARWQLVRLVTSASHQLKANTGDEVDRRADDAAIPSFIPLRKRFTTYRGSRYFTHDLLLPTDECDDDLLRSSAPKRSSTKRCKTQNLDRVGSRKHKAAERCSSLQVTKHKVKPAPMLRQSSSPTINCNPNAEVDLSRILQPDASQTRYSLRQMFPMSQKHQDSQVDGPRVVRQRSLIERLLSRSASRNKSAAAAERERTPVHRLVSTNSTLSEDYGDDDDFNVDNVMSDRLMTDEEREYGTIPRRVYMEYFRACGLPAGSLYLGSAVAWQALRVYTDVWLGDWTGKGTEDDGDFGLGEMTHYFTVYAVLSVASIIMSFTSNAVGQYAGALARRTLHIKLLDNIIRCPLAFFETTPLGRIINRFSTDIGIIDKKIATSIQRLLQFLFMCLSAILINMAVTPWFLILAIPICVVYYIIQKFYRCSARELQRLDAITKSPIFSHFNETFGGLSSIRAYSQQDRFTSILWTKMDVNTNAFIILNSSNRWLGVALDYLGAFIVFVAIIAALISAKLNPATVTPSLVGLAINYTLLVPIYLNWVVKFLSDMEMYMSAVERVQQYSSLATEDYRENAVALPNSWPHSGEVTFSGVSLRYGESREPVVNKIDLHIPAGQRLAVCGRTGSGKSSLLLSLLQLVDVSEGSLLLDGVDLRRAPLHQLRDRVAAAPQECGLFGGTVRDNLDPRGAHSDDQLWRALEAAQLKDMVAAYPGGIDGVVSEGGVGWSGGERQLLGLARALLRQSPLMLLDEPTSSLDPSTEATLLAAIVPGSRTLITIAHRLSTIMDYDRVIVMDAGRVVEDGSPRELLARPMSIFSSMVRASED